MFTSFISHQNYLSPLLPLAKPRGMMTLLSLNECTHLDINDVCQIPLLSRCSKMRQYIYVFLVTLMKRLMWFHENHFVWSQDGGCNTCYSALK